MGAKDSIWAVTIGVLFNILGAFTLSEHLGNNDEVGLWMRIPCFIVGSFLIILAFSHFAGYISNRFVWILSVALLLFSLSWSMGLFVTIFVKHQDEFCNSTSSSTSLTSGSFISTTEMQWTSHSNQNDHHLQKSHLQLQHHLTNKRKQRLQQLNNKKCNLDSENLFVLFYLGLSFFTLPLSIALACAPKEDGWGHNWPGVQEAFGSERKGRKFRDEED